MGSTQIRLMHLTTIASTIPLGIPPKAPGLPLSSVSAASLFEAFFSFLRVLSWVEWSDSLCFFFFSSSPSSSCNPRKVHHTTPLCSFWTWWTSCSGSAKSALSRTACFSWHPQPWGMALTDHISLIYCFVFWLAFFVCLFWVFWKMFLKLYYSGFNKPSKISSTKTNELCVF